MSRKPDREGILSRTAPALVWAGVTDALLDGLASMTGLSRESLADELARRGGGVDPLAESDLTVRAWQIPLPQVPPTPDEGATLALWIVNGPFHPMWRWWQLAIVHLRPIPGVKPATLKRDGASHEVMILSLDPKREPDIDALDRGDYSTFPGYLTPPDLVYQVVGLDDEQAVTLAEHMIEAIVAGRLAPDSDFRERWHHALDQTAEHLRYSGHPGLN
jgi:hypothetical protein